MTNQHLYRHQASDSSSKLIVVRRLVTSLICGGVIAMTGCGGSKSSPESTVVTPPAPTTIGQSSESTDPPGGIELPPGEIPSATSDGGAEKSGGIEMPTDAAIPADSGAASEETKGSDRQVLYATWEQIQASAKSSGRITVVDLWSLSCEPCLKEFPGLVQLHRSMGTKVACVAVDLDFDGRKTRPPEYYQSGVEAFLRSVSASGFPVYICQTPNEDVYAASDIASIPAVVIYDANGDVVKVFVDAGETAGFTYEKDIVPLVTDLAG